jgi:8-amino-7-oxononanoate synthase
VSLDRELAARVGLDRELAAHVNIDREPAARVSLDRELAAQLEELAARGQRRELPAAAAGEAGVDFASNDYLGLARSPALVEAAREAVRRHGAGGRAARLLGGGSAVEAELEAAAA